VGEEDEVSIGTLAQTVAKAMEFKGEMVVSSCKREGGRKGEGVSVVVCKNRSLCLVC